MRILHAGAYEAEGDVATTRVGYCYLGLVWNQPATVPAGHAPQCTFRFESPRAAARAVRQAVAAEGYHAALEMLAGAGHRTWRSLATCGDGSFRADMAAEDKFFLVDYVSSGRRSQTRLSDPQTPVRYGVGPDAAAMPRDKLSGLHRSVVEMGDAGMWGMIDVMALAGI